MQEDFSALRNVFPYKNYPTHANVVLDSHMKADLGSKGHNSPTLELLLDS